LGGARRRSRRGAPGGAGAMGRTGIGLPPIGVLRRPGGGAYNPRVGGADSGIRPPGTWRRL